jgi:hypothetical protein
MWFPPGGRPTLPHMAGFAFTISECLRIPSDAPQTLIDDRVRHSVRVAASRDSGAFTVLLVATIPVYHRCWLLAIRASDIHGRLQSLQCISSWNRSVHDHRRLTCRSVVTRRSDRPPSDLVPAPARPARSPCSPVVRSGSGDGSDIR